MLTLRQSACHPAPEAEAAEIAQRILNPVGNIRWKRGLSPESGLEHGLPRTTRAHLPERVMARHAGDLFVDQ
jgi:hypothetical protein